MHRLAAGTRHHSHLCPQEGGHRSRTVAAAHRTVAAAGSLEAALHTAAGTTAAGDIQLRRPVLWLGRVEGSDSVEPVSAADC